MDESPCEFLRFLARSPNRVTVLGAVASDAVVSRPELQLATGIPRSTLSRILGELGDRGMVSKVGHRYKVTPFGGFVADRLDSIVDSIAVVQRLNGLLDQLSDSHADLGFTSQTNSEILTATSADPRAPVRRFTDLLHSASHVRLVLSVAIPEMLEEDSTIRSGKSTFEIVIPSSVLKADDALDWSRRFRPVLASGVGTVFSYDGDIPYLAGMVDETAVVGLTNNAGTIRGYVETDDEHVQSWANMTVEAYVRNSDRILPPAPTD